MLNLSARTLAATITPSPLALLLALALTACASDDPASSGSTSDATATMTAATDGSTSDSSTSDSSESDSGGSTGTTDDASGSGSDSASDSNGGSSDSDSDSDGPGAAGQCLEACEVDADCRINGLNLGYACEDERCVRGDDECASDDACVAAASGWGVACASQDECLLGACVDIGGDEGRCAPEPTALTPCALLLLEELLYPAIEGGDEIAVCGRGAAICDDGECGFACSDDAQCPRPDAPACNLDSGACECTADSDCADVPGASVCIAGSCGCATDSDCEALDNADTCQANGVCGCSSVDACDDERGFDSTEYVCAPA